MNSINSVSKFIILIGVYLIANNYASAQNSCYYSISLNDSWGDGWNGASLDVTVGGTTNNITLNSGYSSFEIIQVSSGDAMSFSFNSGSYDNEITFMIIDPAGSPVGSYGPYPSTGTFHTISSANCPPSVNCVLSATTTLPFLEDFSGSTGNGTLVGQGEIYCGTDYSWRFESSSIQGTAVWGNQFPVSGTTALSLASTIDGASPYPVNSAILTLDLSPYSNSQYLELSFDFYDAGDESHVNDRVWIRGSSNDPWVEAFDLNSGAASWTNSGPIDIDDLLNNTSPSQAISNTFQIKFGQEDNYTWGMDGIAFDNIRVEEVICLPIAAPLVEDFSSSQIPNCWKKGAISGDGWRFSGSPAYAAASNGRAAGTFAWIDFSSTDVGTILQPSDAGFTSVATPMLEFYFYSNNTNSSSLNILYVEAWDGSIWKNITTVQENNGGWTDYSFNLSGFLMNSTTARVRFRGESGGASDDYFNDLLIDDIRFYDANPLPVKLSDFSVDCHDDENTIQWSTVSESNSSHFIIEQSSNDLDWISLIEIPAAGESNEILEYTTTHKKRTESAVYYRLKQFDIDGQFQLFPTVVADCNSSSPLPELEVFPNPSSNELTLRLNDYQIDTEHQLTLVGLDGKIYYQETIVPSFKGKQINLSTSNLSNGIYLITLNKGNNPQFRERIMILR